MIAFPLLGVSISKHPRLGVKEWVEGWSERSSAKSQGVYSRTFAYQLAEASFVNSVSIHCRLRKFLVSLPPL